MGAAEVVEVALVALPVATVLHEGKRVAVAVGVGNNECPLCRRRSFRVYEPAFRPLLGKPSFFSDGFLAKCRREECGLTIGDFREFGPDAGGWYGEEPPGASV